MEDQGNPCPICPGECRELLLNLVKSHHEEKAIIVGEVAGGASSAALSSKRLISYTVKNRLSESTTRIVYNC